MPYYSKPLNNLINELVKLPGIGPKTAQRLAFFILERSNENVTNLARALVKAKSEIHFCRDCFNFANDELCPICQDQKRDHTVICVVEDAKDIVAIEKTHQYHGLYHVLQGTLSPIDGIGPEQLKIAQLLKRVKSGTVKEVVLATNPNVTGEQTAMYIAKLLRGLNIKLSRIASGIPVGGELEYADELTLGRALDGRTEI